MTVSDVRRRIAEPTAADAIWGILIAAYFATRLAAVVTIPTASLELHDLTAAWLAHVDSGNGLQPTLVQGIALLSFEWTESGDVVRWLALPASASLPFAIIALRHRIGEVGALVALAVITFSGPVIYLTSTASASAFDLPVVAWGLVWLDRSRGPMWIWPLVGFLVATSGPVVLAFALAAGVTFAAMKATYRPRQAALAAGGALAGVAVASVQFGAGWDGIAVPPLYHLAEAYGDSLAGGSSGLLIPLYLIPAVAGAVGGLILFAARRRSSGNAPNRWWATVVVSWGLAALWALTMVTSGSPAALAALVIPSALLTGYAVDAWARRMDTFEWRTPLLAYVGAAALLTTTGYVLATWARRGESGDAWEAILLVVTLVGAFSALTIIALGRRTAPTLVAAGALPAAALMLVGTFGVAFGSRSEPLFSPHESRSGRDLRELARVAAVEGSGPIVVVSSLEDDVVWAFRGLAAYAVSSDIPIDAAVLILPLGALTPEGFTPLEGSRRLVTSIEPPTTPLQFVRWLTDRTSLDSSGVEASVYIRAGR